MQLVEKMTMQPHTCLYCGRGNSTTNTKGENGPYVDLQRDVNFNETVYICETCALEVGSLVGMITADDRRELIRKLKGLSKKCHNLEADLEKMTRRKLIADKKLQAVGTSIKIVHDVREKAGV